VYRLRYLCQGTYLYRARDLATSYVPTTNISISRYRSYLLSLRGVALV